MVMFRIIASHTNLRMANECTNQNLSARVKKKKFGEKKKNKKKIVFVLDKKKKKLFSCVSLWNWNDYYIIYIWKTF